MASIISVVKRKLASILALSREQIEVDRTEVVAELDTQSNNERDDDVHEDRPHKRQRRSLLAGDDDDDDDQEIHFSKFDSTRPLAQEMPKGKRGKPLLGYRLALIRDVHVRGMTECMLREFGADVLHVSTAPTSDYETFVEWWIRETERAVRDQVQLVVVKAYYCTAFSYLKRIEEEEFYSQGEQRTRVRFTTEQKLKDAISCKEAIKDDWGDTIQSFGHQSTPTDQSLATVLSSISSSAKLLSPSQNNESINSIVVNVTR